jgi:hypothetical protein
MVFSLLISLVLGLFHPLHVSVTEIEFDEKEKELEIISRIFTDDLETAIRADRQLPELDLLNPAGGLKTNELVKEYVLKRITITVEGKEQKLNFLGFENDGEALICYIQVKDLRKVKNITIVQSVLLETFDDQSNLVHVTVSGKVKSLRLMRNNPAGKLEF